MLEHTGQYVHACTHWTVCACLHTLDHANVHANFNNTVLASVESPNKVRIWTSNLLGGCYITTVGSLIFGAGKSHSPLFGYSLSEVPLCDVY